MSSYLLQDYGKKETNTDYIEPPMLQEHETSGSWRNANPTTLMQRAASESAVRNRQGDAKFNNKRIATSTGTIVKRGGTTITEQEEKKDDADRKTTNLLKPPPASANTKEALALPKKIIPSSNSSVISMDALKPEHQDQLRTIAHAIVEEPSSGLTTVTQATVPKSSTLYAYTPPTVATVTASSFRDKTEAKLLLEKNAYGNDDKKVQAKLQMKNSLRSDDDDDDYQAKLRMEDTLRGDVVAQVVTSPVSTTTTMATMVPLPVPAVVEQPPKTSNGGRSKCLQLVLILGIGFMTIVLLALLLLLVYLRVLQ